VRLSSLEDNSGREHAIKMVGGGPGRTICFQAPTTQREAGGKGSEKRSECCEWDDRLDVHPERWVRRLHEEG